MCRSIITRLTTGDELAAQLATAIQARTIAGLNDNQVRATPNGVLSIGGQTGLGLEVNRGERIRTIGVAGDTGAPSLSIFLPVALQLPAAPADGEQFVLRTVDGTSFVFEFDLNGTLTSNGAIGIPFDANGTSSELGNAVATAIRGSAVGIEAISVGSGQVALGQVALDRIDVSNSNVTIVQGTPLDGEVLTISQGNTSVTFEFELAVGGGGVEAGNVEVTLQPDGTTADFAAALADAINMNLGGLSLTASVATRWLSCVDWLERWSMQMGLQHSRWMGKQSPHRSRL